MAHAGRARQADGFDGQARFDEPLREPAVAGLGAKEIARAHHDDLAALAAGRLQVLLHLHTDGALAGERLLGGVFAQHGEGAGAKVVDRAGQHDGGANGLCGGNGVVHHGQHQLGPAAVARWVDGVHDDSAALGGGQHVGTVHGVALHPFDAALLASGLPCATAQGAHGPARGHQLPGHFAPNAAGGAQYQCRMCQCCVVAHLITPSKRVAME